MQTALKKEIKKASKPYWKATSRMFLNRVINLETGSLGVEAGLKMMLARFYKLDGSFSAPKYEGKMPVFFVMGDHENGDYRELPWYDRYYANDAWPVARIV